MVYSWKLTCTLLLLLLLLRMVLLGFKKLTMLNDEITENLFIYGQLGLDSVFQ